MIITKEIASDFYISCMLYKLLLKRVYKEEEELAFQWEKKVAYELAIVAEKVKNDNPEDYDEDVFLAQLQILCNNISRISPEVPFESNWIIKLVEAAKKIVNEECK